MARATDPSLTALAHLQMAPTSRQHNDEGPTRIAFSWLMPTEYGASARLGYCGCRPEARSAHKKYVTDSAPACRALCFLQVL